MQYYKITMQYCCHCCSDKHLGLERSQHSRQPGCTGLHSQGCAKIGQKVIMAGGYAEGILGTTEVLNLVKRERSGGPLTTPKNYLRLATIFSEGRRMWLQLVKISKNMFITSHYFNMGVMLVLTHHDTVSGKWREIMLTTLTLLQSFQLFVSFILLSLSTWLGAV